MDFAVSFLPHAFPIEMLQFLAANIGTVASIWGTHDAWKDLDFLHRTGLNGHRLFVAKRNFFEEVMRLVLHILFWSSGLFSLLAPPPSTFESFRIEDYSQLWVSRLVMTLASIILMIKSIRDNRDRKRLRFMVGHVHEELLDAIKDKAADIVTVINDSKQKSKE